jgi:TRAP-type C4-dicarboxylate transport system permease small subunit
MTLICGLCLILMAALTFINVLARYVFSAPIFGSSEIVQILLALLVFSAFAPVSAADRHIKVDLFDKHLDKLIPRGRNLIVNILSAISLLLIAYELFSIALTAIENDRTTTVLQIPLAYVLLPVSLFCFFASIVQFTYLKKKKHNA